MRLSNYLVSFVALSCLGAFATVQAQAGKAEVTGAVRDQNNAAITQARDAVTEVATGQTYVTRVTDNGEYTITNLKPGRLPDDNQFRIRRSVR
jgi:hypothetical protein